MQINNSRIITKERAAAFMDEHDGPSKELHKEAFLLLKELDEIKDAIAEDNPDDPENQYLNFEKAENPVETFKQYAYRIGMLDYYFGNMAKIIEMERNYIDSRLDMIESNENE